MVEERVNAMRGYKAALKNPKVPDEGKEHARYMLENELGGDKPREEIHAAQSGGSRDPTRVAAGYKAAKWNPRVTGVGKEHASQKLKEMGETPED